MDDFWVIIGGVAVSLFLAGWAWFKARAANTAAQWDDAAVREVERIAQKIVDANKPVEGR